MSLPKKLAQGVRRPIGRVLALARHSASYPFDTPLTREIHRLERRWSEKPLRAMGDLPGLEPPPRHGLTGLAYQVVRHYKPRVVVQLGARDGLAALAIGAALRDTAEGGKLYLVDDSRGDDDQPWMGHRARLGLDAAIVPLRMGHDAARDQVARPIDLLVIDAGRSRQAVEGDWDDYAAIVRPGGMVLFPGVRSDPEVRRFWRSMTRNHENHSVRRHQGLGVIRTKAQ
jgi:predicted O-methyltransferase YrrM